MMHDTDIQKHELYLKSHKHEYVGVLYLIQQGYNILDININTVYTKSGINDKNIGKPDITTKNDKKNWEVKIITRARYGFDKIVFTPEQIIRIPNDTEVLIFFKGDPNPRNIIKFGDIVSGINKSYKYVVQMELDIDTALPIINQISEKKNEKKNLINLFLSRCINLKHLKADTIDRQFLDIKITGNSFRYPNHTYGYLPVSKLCQNEDEEYFLVLNDVATTLIRDQINKNKITDLIGITLRFDWHFRRDDEYEWSQYRSRYNDVYCKIIDHILK